MRSNITTEQANALYQDKHMFHIVVGDGNKMEIDNASVPVRWCLNDKMIDHLKKLQKQAYVCLTALHPEERRSGEYRWIPLSRVIVPITDSLPVAANKFSNGTVGSPPECLQLNQSDISTLHLFKDFIIEYNYCYRLVDAIPAFVKASMVIPDDREYLIMNRLINFIIRNDLSNTIDAAVHMFVESEQ